VADVGQGPWLAALEAYAGERSLDIALDEHQSLEKGGMGIGATESYLHTLIGTLPGGADGSMRVRTTAAEFRGRNQIHVGVTVDGTLPESVPYVPVLVCHRDARNLGVHFDASGLRSIVFESVALEEKFLIRVVPEQDENWLYQLFPPTFIDWLAEHAPLSMIVGLDRGELKFTLTEDVHDPSADSLDRYAEVYSRVALRIREECAEEAPNA